MNLSSGKLIVKVSWGGVKDSADGPSKIAADIDLQAVCFNDNGVAVDACYWNNERAAGGALVHGGDEKNDNGGEELIVMLDQLPVSTCTVAFTLSSFLPLLPLARVDDVVVTFEYVPTTGATQHMTLFPQFNETTCRPGLVSAVGHLARMGKQSFELHRYGDGVLTPRSTFVDSIPMLRELARLPAPSPSMATLICIPINLAKGETAAVFTPSVDTFRPVAGVPFDGALHAGVGWDVASRGAEATDVDLSAILLDNDYNIVHRVYWGELDGFNGAIKHHGDNETGEDSDGREGGDDEVIFVDLTRLPQHVHRVVFLVSNYGAASLASAKHLHFHLVNARTNQTLVRIEECQTRIDTPGMLTAMLVRAPNAAWNVVALNEGVAGDSVLAKATTEAVIGVVRRAVVDSHLPESLRTTVGSLHHVPASSRPTNAAATGRGKGKAESGRQQQDQAQVSRTNTKDNRPVNPTEFYTQAAVVVLIAVLLWYCLKYLRWA